MPYPLVGGDRIRNYNLIRRVASRHEVSLAAFLEAPGDIDGVSHLKQFCDRVETGIMHRRHPLSHLPGLLRFALAGKPLELLFLQSEKLTDKIRKLISTKDFDIVQIDSRMGLYLETFPLKRSCKSIIMFQNYTSNQYRLISNIEQRWIGKIRALLNSVSMGRWESRYAERFDRCTTVSDIERQLLIKDNPRLRVEVIPNGVDIQKYKPLRAANALPALLFIGNMSYAPCADAALYFCREIFSKIRRKIGTANLWIVGRDPGSAVMQLDGDGIHVTGRVDDVIPYYRQSAVCVVPLRAGGGTRLKILEGMARGRPVVSTTIGSEGLEVVDGEHLLIADNPEQFAEKTVRLLTDRQLYQFISTNGRKLVETSYDWDKIAGRLMEVYANILSQRDLPSR